MLQKVFVALIFLSLSVISPPRGEAQVAASAAIPAAILGKAGRDWIKDTRRSLDTLLARAMSDTNWIAEQRIRQIELALALLLENLEGVLDRKIGALDAKIQDYIGRIEKMLADTLEIIEGGIERAAVSLQLSLHDICQGLPFCEAVDSFSGFRGLWLTDNEGLNAVTISGTALRRSPDIRVWVGGQLLDQTFIEGTRADHERRVRIPKKFLSFKDKEINRIPMRIVASREMNKGPMSALSSLIDWITGNSDALAARAEVTLYLLPRAPVLANAFEITVADTWKGCDTCERTYTGRRDRAQQITTHWIPLEKDERLTQVLIKPTHKYGEAAEKNYYWFYCTEPRMESRKPDDRGVMSTCRAWVVHRNCNREYENLVKNPDQAVRDSVISYRSQCYEGLDEDPANVVFRVRLEKRQRELVARPLELLGATKIKKGHLLRYGEYLSEYFTDLSSDADFEVRVAVNGSGQASRTVVLTPGSPSAIVGGITRVSARMEEIGVRRRIRVNVTAFEAP
jgi:hypothetical protein